MIPANATDNRVHKQLSFYTFGGHINASCVPGETVYTIYSPAPILDLHIGGPVELPFQLVDEVESLFAKTRVCWGNDDIGFLRRLAQIDPISLYATVLAAILDNYRHAKPLRTAVPNIYHLLITEQTWLAEHGFWSTDTRQFSDLVASGT